MPPGNTDVAPIPKAEQAEHRRRQFVELAAHLVAHEGPDAVHPARLAQLAGCTRSLVYRYFPTMDDLLREVAAAWNQRIGERLRTLYREGSIDVDTMFDLVWDEIDWDAVGPVGAAQIVLRVRPGQGGADEGVADWIRVFADGHHSDTEARVLFEASIAVMNTLLAEAKRGSVTRDEARRINRRCLLALTGDA